MLLIFILIHYITLVSARASLQQDEYCFVACQQILRSVRFNNTAPKTGQPWPACGNELEFTSLYLCNKLYCTDDERKRGIDGLNEKCRRFYNSTAPPYSLIDGFTGDEILELHHLEVGELNREAPSIYNEVLVPSKKLYGLAWDTLDAAYFELDIHVIYGFAMYYFWMAVVSVGLISRLMQLVLNSISPTQKWQEIPSDPHIENGVTKRAYHPYTLVKRYITVPATFGFTHAQNIKWCTVPTRIQSIAIAAFVIFNIVLCSVSYHVFEYNLYWPSVSTQVWRYVADRTGIISTANLALIWAFGIRNNTLLWLTGWDFATYNNFHRWVARVATVEAVVHSVAYTVLIFENGTWTTAWQVYADYYQGRWFVAGVLATVFMVGVCAFSVYPLRRKLYEIFLFLHIVLSILVLATMWYHVEIFNGDYNGFIWSCVFIWIFDRLSRIARILLFNRRFWNTKAQVTYDSTSNIIRLVVPYSTSIIKPSPGTFYFISVLNDRIWESHPFTLSYSTSDDTSSPSSSLGTITPPSRPSSLSRSRENSSESQTLLSQSQSETPPASMVFIIRPYNGFTSRLRSHADSYPTRVLIEGPYGETQPFRKYENVLFIVGGTGIAVPLSYMDSLLESSSTSSIKVIWAVREHQFLHDAITRDFRGAIGSEKLSLEAYITNDSGVDELKDDVGLKVHIGRPDVVQEVEEAARDSGGRPLAVVACGPGLMADETRRAVVQMLERGYGNVEYFEESFNW
ncbi:hypothetical protein HYFRA_00010869 [Hymenoscyphus fraxineus]|uniref:FAD-binding FR-type domain-containing protein n=1 Tax=Hymenoscyphus fraxineus TaxID=746836 RepID=A0A9N9KWI1_9HELO|nr:hypothetical protein HYFRA_00010869 [Hymenoscyphus fraxineus]